MTNPVEPAAKRPKKGAKKSGKKRGKKKASQPQAPQEDTTSFHRVENTDDPRSPEERGVAVVHQRDLKGRFTAGGNPGNSGGKKGRSGRYTGSFKRFCRNVLRRPATRAGIILAAENPTLAGYNSLIKLLAERGEGPVEKAVAVRHTHFLVHVDV